MLQPNGAGEFEGWRSRLAGIPHPEADERKKNPAGFFLTHTGVLVKTVVYWWVSYFSMTGPQDQTNFVSISFLTVKKLGLSGSRWVT